MNSTSTTTSTTTAASSPSPSSAPPYAIKSSSSSPSFRARHQHQRPQTAYSPPPPHIQLVSKPGMIMPSPSSLFTSCPLPSSSSTSASSSGTESRSQSHSPVSLTTPPPPRLHTSLEAYLDCFYPAQSTAVRAVKLDVLARLRLVCERWAREQLQSGFTNVELLVYGSFRLGVSQDADDIDVCLVVPRGLHRGHFFADNAPPASGTLLSLLRQECDWVLPIQTAYVPLIKLQWRGVELDLVFASLQDRDWVPPPSELLLGYENAEEMMDAKSQLSLNGPRVTERLLQRCNETTGGGGGQDRFRVVLRALRHWAKLRGLYNNKFGFLGGINFAILAALVVVEDNGNGNASSSSSTQLVARAMHMVANWEWPTPLCIGGGGGGSVLTPRDLLPILTPVFPPANSALSVTPCTKRILLDEFRKSSSSLGKEEEEVDWAAFFRSPGFFSRFPVHVVVTAQYKDDEEVQEDQEAKEDATSATAGVVVKAKQWMLLVECKIRRLCDLLEQQQFDAVFPYQVGIPICGGMRWVVGLSRAVTTAGPAGATATAAAQQTTNRRRRRAAAAVAAAAAAVAAAAASEEKGGDDEGGAAGADGLDAERAAVAGVASLFHELCLREARDPDRSLLTVEVCERVHF